jgi:hypothetical protein
MICGFDPCFYKDSTHKIIRQEERIKKFFLKKEKTAYARNMLRAQHPLGTKHIF